MGSFAGSHYNYFLSSRRRQRRSSVNRALHIFYRSQYYPVMFRGGDGLVILIIFHAKGTAGAIDFSQPEHNLPLDPR